MSDLILPFAAIRDTSLPAVGAKALSLARMARLGLPVPAGFCVTVQAYRQHLAEHDLDALVKETIPAAREADPVEKSRLLASLRDAITTGVLPVEFRKLVEQSFQQLDARRIAVRSSSTVEDLPGLSFAGLYDTLLLKGDVWTCLDAVKKCWASLWTERAFDYREKNRVDHINAGMCVIVQKMISAEASGVIFTADPVTGDRERLTIEAVFGLGEGAVSGRVAPDRFVLARDDLRILEQTVSRKTLEMVFTEQWGVREWPIDPERQEQPALTPALAQRLGKLARQVEQAFTSPQDIEWALKDGEPFLLQARPITTSARDQAWAAKQVWTNVNIGEAMPEAAPPMARSGLRKFAGNLLRYIGRLAGVRISMGDEAVFNEIAGRVYFNVNALLAIGRGIPIVNRMELSELLGGVSDELTPDPGDLPQIKTNRLKAVLGLPGLMVWFLRSQPESGRKAVERLKQETDALQRTDFTAWKDEDLPAQVFHGLQQVFDRTGELGGAMTGMQYFTLLARNCRKWFNDPKSTIASKLLTGLGDINSAQAGLEIWRLAEMARARPQLQKLVGSDLPWTELRPKLPAVELGDEFLARWDRLMFAGGHHCRGEFDVSKPRWRDQPDFVLATVRSYLRAGMDFDPEAALRQQVVAREQLVDECRKRLRNPVKRLEFDFLLKRAQLGACVRENLRDDINRRVAIARMALLELGERLVKQGTIAERDDVFFFYEPELIPVLKGIQSFDIRNTISDRKAEYRRNLGIFPPSVVVGRFDPDASQSPDPLIPGTPDSLNPPEILTGLAVSPGIATGPARVIMSYNHDETVLPGEILVAPFTDPGWTPYFLPAAGIVVDVGGLLSHGSIVAREYGKPAVVNVGPATRIIKTGQMIQVDGNQGKVRILR
jgi:phosphohistidine swiveling domain-containing protein